MLKSSTTVRVRFAETDAMSVVYHGNYFTWFECARITMMDEIGLPYSVLHAKDYHLPVIEAWIKYLYPAKFDDLVTIHATVKEMPAVKIRIDYDVECNGKLLCQAYTVHAFVNGRGMPVKPDKEFIQKFKEKFD